MVALRCLYLIALVFWVGGMVALGAFAAPATFDVLEGYYGATGRLQAGDVFDEMLRRFRHFEYGSAVVLLGSLGALGARDPKLPALAVRIGTVAIMLAVSLYAGFGIASQVAGLQAEIDGNLAAWTDSSLYAARFDRLYAQTTMLLLLNLGLGLSLIYWEARARIS